MRAMQRGAPWWGRVTLVSLFSMQLDESVKRIRKSRDFPITSANEVFQKGFFPRQRSPLQRISNQRDQLIVEPGAGRYRCLPIVIARVNGRVHVLAA